MSSRVSCAVSLCDNSYANCQGLNISFHNFPKDPQMREKWIKALGKSEDWNPKGYLRVCSAHFTPDNFSTPNVETPSMKHYLKRNAVPNILDPNLLKRARLSHPALSETEIIPGPSSNPAIEIMEVGESSSEISDLPQLVFQENPTHFHTYASKKSTVNIATQAKPTCKSVGLQVNTIDLGVSQGVQCEIFIPSPSKSTKSSVDIFYGSDDDDDDDEENKATPSTPVAEPIGSPLLSLSSLGEVDTNLESSYDPGSESTEFSQESKELEMEEDEFKLDDAPPHHQDKFIVFSSFLLLLFKTCHVCHQKPVINIKRRIVGSLLHVTTECLDGHVFKWQSQPMFGFTSWGNYLLAASMFFAGVLPTKLLTMFTHFKLRCFNIRMYFYYQLMFHPIIERVFIVMILKR